MIKGHITKQDTAMQLVADVVEAGVQFACRPESLGWVITYHVGA